MSRMIELTNGDDESGSQKIWINRDHIVAVSAGWSYCDSNRKVTNVVTQNRIVSVSEKLETVIALIRASE